MLKIQSGTYLLISGWGDDLIVRFFDWQKKNKIFPYRSMSSGCGRHEAFWSEEDYPYVQEWLLAQPELQTKEEVEKLICRRLWGD